MEYDHDGEGRLSAVGPDRHGRMLELVAVPGCRTDPRTVIGAASETTRQAAPRGVGGDPALGLTTVRTPSSCITDDRRWDHGDGVGR
ncbi:MAG: hypothetical protein ACRCY9_18870 [Phycicoccus sp.]